MKRTKMKTKNDYLCNLFNKKVMKNIDPFRDTIVSLEMIDPYPKSIVIGMKGELILTDLF